LNARFYRNHDKTAGTVGSALHPQKRVLQVWLSKDRGELFAKVWFSDDASGWQASADVEAGLLPACSLSFLPLRRFPGGTVSNAAFDKMARGLADGYHVLKSTPPNWWQEVAVNEISLVPEGHHPAAILWDYSEGNPVWRPMWRGKVG
jgi:hypothetical protein